MSAVSDSIPEARHADVRFPLALAQPRLNASVALVHDWFTVYSGSERVFEQMLKLFPAAEVYGSIDFLPEAERGFLAGRTPVTSMAQHWPGMRKHYRKWLPFLMFAVEQLDVSKHDLIVSSSAAIAKGVLTGPGQLHISYVHSPMRYAWDLQHQYLRESRLERGLGGLMARWFLHRARFWDLRTANGVDHYVANSQFIANRIWKVYRRQATVIHPPVDTVRFALRERKDDFYLTVARLVPYKRIPTIVQAFERMPDRRLVVIGDGPDMQRIKQIAGKNVEILGHQSSDTLLDYMQRARAFLFAAEEDFGISPVEAQSCGTPVIAFGRGGAVETVRGPDHPQSTGLFFAAQEPELIVAAVRDFERREAQFTPQACRENALRFSTDVFREKFSGLVERCWGEFKAKQ